jgi:opacity protein-like surface antigen
MKKALLLAASVALVAPQAFAQAKNFEGFSAAANLEIASPKIELAGTALPDSVSGTSTNVGLQARYDLPLDKQFVLGFGGSYTLGDRKVGDSAANGVTLKSRSNYSLDLTPGVAVSDTMLVYGKFAILRGTGSSTNIASGVETTNDLKGLGYGLGVRSMIDKNMFLQAAYDYNKYDDYTDGVTGVTGKATSSIFSIGVGYKF